MSFSFGAAGNEAFHTIEMSTSASASARARPSFGSFSRKLAVTHGVLTLASSVGGKWWMSDP
jgi:hypothetical protein